MFLEVKRTRMKILEEFRKCQQILTIKTKHWQTLVTDLLSVFIAG